jgi:tetratricopeptide (TPR) repeat protein
MATRKKGDPVSTAEKSRSRSSHVGETEGSAAASTSSAQIAAGAQLTALEEGLRLFRQQRFIEAKECFERALQGSDSAVRFAAKTHLSVCERRIQKPALNLVTAEDHYNYGIERLNARDIEAARRHLQIAVALQSGSEHMLYALAAALALSGDVSGSYENLRRAIEIEPRNRVSARQDSDFSGVAHNPLFLHLFHPEKNL